MTGHDLLQEMLAELVPPLLLIGTDRHIRYASPAFMRLAGLGDTAPPCDALLHPAKSLQTSGHCCWDVLQTYLAAGESALWQLRDGEGGWQPVWCDIRSIEVAHRSVMIAIEAHPLRGLASPAAIGFFRGLRNTSADAGEYERHVANYLRKHYGFSQVLWPHAARRDAGGERSTLATGLLAAIEAIAPEARHNGLFDVIVVHDGREQIFHILQTLAETPPVWLAVSGAGWRLNIDTLGCLQAAAAAWRPTAATPASHRPMLSPALIELLSPAEREVLAYLQAGLSDKEIAGQRRVSLHTVRNQVNAVMHKLGVHKRAQLAAWNQAMRQDV